MKLTILCCFLTLLCTVNGDLLDEQFFIYLLNNIVIPSARKFDPPALVSFAGIFTNAIYDSLVPYLDKSVALCSSIPKRPVNERTIRNKNIAIGYAVYRVLELTVPTAAPTTRVIFESLNLNVDDRTVDITTPIGIANFASQKVFDLRLKNGMNQLGDLNGKMYFHQIYEDYTGYEPNNTAYHLEYPGKWQPNIELIGYGTYFVQQHVFPQYGRTKSYVINSSLYSASSPPFKSNPENEGEYKKQVDEILRESANLNDYRKMVAEHFDDKVGSLFSPLIFLAQKYGLDQDEIIKIDFLTNTVLFDTGIVVWREKIKYDAVRPFSAVRYVYGDKFVTAWGGPGVGKVKNLRARDWSSYIRTAAHAEYPSGSACFCSAEIAMLKKYFKTNDFGYSVFKPKGSSVIEPGVTPSQDITLGPYATFDDYLDECANSRLWGGVHFRSAIKEGKTMCAPIGEAVYNVIIKYLDGTV